VKEKLTRAEISRRYRENNPEKFKESQKKYRDANKKRMSERQRKYQLQNKYGITEKDYEDMLISQEGKCAICETEDKTGKWQRFGVDHCHVTGKVRALLCNECNRGIGLLRDSSELLRKAANYLDSHKAITQQENKDRK
jgi:hypothetical protein